MRFNLDNYETVEARLAKFWDENPNGQVSTSIYHYDETRVVFKAEIYKDISDPRPVSTGFAEEVRDASPVNRTSHVENAETSSIGRALANWTFAAKTSPRPSRQEMEKVERMTETKPDADLLSKFREACAKAGVDPENVANSAGLDMYDLTNETLPKLRDAFKKMQQKTEPEPVKQGTFIENVKAVFPEAKEEEPQIRDPYSKASSAQLGKLRAMLMANGIGDRATQSETISEIVGRPIAKFDMLTKGEANTAIKALEARNVRE